MSFNDYLQKTQQIAHEEGAVLDQLAAQLIKEKTLNPIEYRAARSALQLIIENAVGKARRTLKEYACPFVPTRANDALDVLRDTGAISDECFGQLRNAVGFRNVMIHDYMEFDEKILFNILQTGRYQHVLDYLKNAADPDEVVKNRIKSYAI